MKKPSNESLLQQHVLLEKEKTLLPDMLALIEHKQELIRVILENKGVIIVFGVLMAGLVYIGYNPPMEYVVRGLEFNFR